jgi:hypothetical protein
MYPPDKQPRRASRRGAASPRKRPLERPTAGAGSWTELEDFLEVFDRGGAVHETIAGRRLVASGAASRGPGLIDAALAGAALLRKTDPENKILAGLYLRWYAGILGPEVSVDILRDHFGPVLLNQSLAKIRRATAVTRDDDERIHAYVAAIRWNTGESGRDACKRLAKMGLQVRKDAKSGRDWVRLDVAETIRKRYMRGAGSGASLGFLRLLQTWHRADEPAFLNWLKTLISKDSAGP